MVDIFIKDTLRSSVEASSGGRQTVLYTAKGQPTFMNILDVLENAKYGAADGMGSIHPAFYYGDQLFSRLFIGTYQGTIVNGELLSLPNKKLDGGTTSMRTYLEAARACGRGHHLMSYKEYTAAIYTGLADGGQNLGNTQNGADRTGHKGINGGGAETVLTGSGNYTWSHDNTLYGIQDLAGNGWEFTGGMRVKGDELQIQGNNRSYNYDTADQYFSEDWWAIDATTGGLIPSTEQGTLNETDFRITTPNSIRIGNSGENLGATSIAKSPWSTNNLGDYLFGAGITEAAKAQLKTFGIIPVSTTFTPNTAYLRIHNDNPYTVTYFVRSGSPFFGDTSGFHSSANIVNSEAMTISSNYARPCYIEI